MNADGTPDMQDVREGNATVAPDGSIVWMAADSNTVTVTAPPKSDTSWMVVVLLAAGAAWLLSE